MSAVSWLYSRATRPGPPSSCRESVTGRWVNQRPQPAHTVTVAEELQEVRQRQQQQQQGVHAAAKGVAIPRLLQPSHHICSCRHHNAVSLGQAPRISTYPAGPAAVDCRCCSPAGLPDALTQAPLDAHWTDYSPRANTEQYWPDHSDQLVTGPTVHLIRSAEHAALQQPHHPPHLPTPHLLACHRHHHRAACDTDAAAALSLHPMPALL